MQWRGVTMLGYNVVYTVLSTYPVLDWLRGHWNTRQNIVVMGSNESAKIMVTTHAQTHHPFYRYSYLGHPMRV